VTVPAARRAPHISALTGAARAAGLHHVGHIAAVDAAGPPDRRRDETEGAEAGCLGDTAAGAAGGSAGRSTSPGGVQPYLDLLIFKPRAGNDG
jgi:hypothetical protein